MDTLRSTHKYTKNTLCIHDLKEGEVEGCLTFSSTENNNVYIHSTHSGDTSLFVRTRPEAKEHLPVSTSMTGNVRNVQPYSVRAARSCGAGWMESAPHV